MSKHLLVNPELGSRYNEEKLNWGLVHYPSLEDMVKVLQYGAVKYEAWNWIKGLPYVATCESLLRHTYSFLNGEDIDPESKLPHTGHIMCNSMFLSHMYSFRPDLDDRQRIMAFKSKPNIDLSNKNIAKWEKTASISIT